MARRCSLRAASGVYWDLATQSDPRFIPPLPADFGASLKPDDFSYPAEAVSAVVALDGGSKLAWGRMDGTILIQDRVTGEHLTSLEMGAGEKAPARVGEEPDGSFVDLAVSTDGRYLAGVVVYPEGDSSLVTIFDSASGEAIFTEAQSHVLLTLVFHPNGRSFVVAGQQAVLMWPSIGGAPKRLGGGAEELISIAYSPDGKLLLAAEYEDERGPMLWDASTGRLISQLPTGTNAAGAIFSSDGRWLYLVVSDQDEANERPRVVGRFDMHLTPLLTEACRIANRTLTQEEVAQFLEGVSETEQCSELLKGRGSGN